MIYALALMVAAQSAQLVVLFLYWRDNKKLLQKVMELHHDQNDRSL